MMKLTWRCMFTPRLYKIYKDGPSESCYQPHVLEKWGDRIISSAHMIMNIGIYTSPFICLYIYRRSFSIDDARGIIRLVGGVGCLIAFAFLMRGLGRASNPKYLQFLKALTDSGTDPKAKLQNIRKYDFDFRYWPVSYAVPPSQTSSWFRTLPFSNCANPELPSYQRGILQVLAFVATHIFGLRLIYPGSLSLVQYLLSSALMQGRTQLVEHYDGLRGKVVTAEGNELDTLFVDQRKKTGRGSTLVICSEGNSGFYEIGIMTTPIKADYSSLGWNHPGFAGSTGLPFPEQEQNAIDAVMQYAINDLGFEPQNIVVFGWSIGGYVAAWAATAYPVKGLILDATFDDLLPLAQNHMPRTWSLLVKEVVRSHVNLNIADLVCQYTGPVQLVRRTEDEIICLRQGWISTNRGNNLLLRLIEHRHPETRMPTENVIAPLEKYVALLDTQRSTLERSEISATDRNYLTLIAKYMRDYKSTHCTPLPHTLFETIMDTIHIQNQK